MNQNSTANHDDASPPPAETVVDALFDYGVIVEDETGGVRTSEAFEHRRSINDDTYLDMDEEAFGAAVSTVFDVAPATVRDRLEAGDLTPEAVSAYFALRGHVNELDREPPRPDLLAAMAEVVVEVVPKSPVPSDLQALGPESYQDFIADAEDVVLIVFKRDCEPCEATKAMLEEIEAAAPDRVTFAGVDAAEVPDLLREYEVEAAPTSLLFAGGELATSLRGHRSMETYQDAFAATYE